MAATWGQSLRDDIPDSNLAGPALRPARQRVEHLDSVCLARSDVGRVADTLSDDDAISVGVVTFEADVGVGLVGGELDPCGGISELG
jgi:hypothetical protein